MSPFRPTSEPLDRVRMDDGREIVLADWVEDMLVLDATDRLTFPEYVNQAQEEWLLFSTHVRLPEDAHEDTTLCLRASGKSVLFGRAWRWAPGTRESEPHALAVRIHLGGLETLRAEFDPECAGARVFLYGLHKKVRA